jgi:hypothetical protein
MYVTEKIQPFLGDVLHLRRRLNGLAPNLEVVDRDGPSARRILAERQSAGRGDTSRNNDMAKDPLFIERNNDGKYAVKRANADRASAVADTQAAAIDRAKQLTDGPIHVERVRSTSVGSPDKWRRL